MTTIVNWNGTAWATPTGGGGTVDPPGPKRIALIGDSTLAGVSEARMRAHLTMFDPANIYWWAVVGKSIQFADSAGKTTLQNIADAKVALGGEPDVWLINLGANLHDRSDAVIQSQVATVMDATTAPVLWVNISQADTYAPGTFTVATRLNWNTKAKAKFDTYARGTWLDWHAAVKARGDAGLWLSDGEHMTATGSIFKGDFLAAAIETFLATTGPPAPLWRKPEIGTMGGDESIFNTHNAAYGPVVCRRIYSTSLPSSWASGPGASDVAAGRHSYWSWKPDLTGFPGSTSQKNAFSAFLDTIPAGHRVTVVAWHEPEDDIARGSFTLAQWGALQEAVAAIVHAKGRPELRFGICLMGPWTFDSRSPHFSLNWDGALDWSVVDTFGIDPYRLNAGSPHSLETMLTVKNSGAGSSGTHPTMMQKLLTYNVPVSLMEWGVSATPEAEAAAWITDAYAWFLRWNQAHVNDADGRIEAAIYYDHTLTTLDTPLTGVEIPAYAAIVADSKIPPTA